MLVNAAVIDEVRDTLGDETYRVFVGRLLNEVAETQGALLKLLGQGDLETLARTAHRTSGSAASIGAVALHAALKQVENTARSAGAAQTLPGLIAALPNLANETRDALLASVPG